MRASMLWTFSFFFSSRRRHTRCLSDWSSDVCSSDLNKLGAFFDVIHQDPVLSQVKLIAEPWDVGPGGYQVGNFPVLWSEWNGKYRDTMRDFWRGRASRGEFASRFAGSSDLYAADGRDPFASI